MSVVSSIRTFATNIAGNAQTLARKTGNGAQDAAKFVGTNIKSHPYIALGIGSGLGLTGGAVSAAAAEHKIHEIG